MEEWTQRQEGELSCGPRWLATQAPVVRRKEQEGCSCSARNHTQPIQLQFVEGNLVLCSHLAAREAGRVSFTSGRHVPNQQSVLLCEEVKDGGYWNRSLAHAIIVLLTGFLFPQSSYLVVRSTLHLSAQMKQAVGPCDLRLCHLPVQPRPAWPLLSVAPAFSF